MFRSRFTSRFVTALVAGGVLAVAHLSAPGAVTTAPTIERVADYPARAETTTELRLQRSTVRTGRPNSATAEVSSDAGTPQGRVTFRAGQYGATVTLVNGRATWDMPRNMEPGDYTVTATYNGNKVFKRSSDSASLTVLNEDGSVAGREGSRENDGSRDGGAGRPGTGDGGGDGVAGDESEGGLPLVGNDPNTTLFTLIGLGLLALGAFTLVGRRRRGHGHG